jgi:hypothetical protein
MMVRKKLGKLHDMLTDKGVDTEKMLGQVSSIQLWVKDMVWCTGFRYNYL